MMVMVMMMMVVMMMVVTKSFPPRRLRFPPSFPPSFLPSLLTFPRSLPPSFPSSLPNFPSSLTPSLLTSLFPPSHPPSSHPDGGSDDKDEPNKTSSIYAFEPALNTWRHVGDLPFEASNVDALCLSGGDLLVVDGDSGRVVRSKRKGATN